MPKYLPSTAIIFCLLFSLTISYSFSQELSIQGELDKAEIQTGEQASVNITIRTNNLADTRFRLSEGVDKSKFEILEFGALDTIELENKLLEIKARLLITSFDSTLIQIPAIITETSTHIDSTKTFALNIIQPKVDLSRPNEIKGIKMPWEVELTFRDILDILIHSLSFWIIILILVITVGLYFIMPWYKNKRDKSQGLEIVEIPLSSLEKLKIQIKELDKLELEKQEDFKLYYSLLINTFKNFIDEELQLHTAEQTSREVLQTLQKEGYSKQEISQLEYVLQLADLSKFAKNQSSKDDTEEAKTIVLNFCKQTYEKNKIEDSKKLLIENKS